MLVYDFLGGEPLMHPDLPKVVAHAKSKRGGSNVVTVITNGFFLGKKNIRGLNEAGLDFMHRVFDHARGEHLREMLLGDFSRPWRCLAAFKFLYVTAKGSVQWCARQRDYSYPLRDLDLIDLRKNNRHKPCAQGCCLGGVRLVSHSLGDPLKNLTTSIPLASSVGRNRAEAQRARPLAPNK